MGGHAHFAEGSREAQAFVAGLGPNKVRWAGGQLVRAREWGTRWGLYVQRKDIVRGWEVQAFVAGPGFKQGAVGGCGIGQCKRSGMQRGPRCHENRVGQKMGRLTGLCVCHT